MLKVTAERPQRIISNPTSFAANRQRHHARAAYHRMKYADHNLHYSVRQAYFKAAPHALRAHRKMKIRVFSENWYGIALDAVIDVQYDAAQRLRIVEQFETRTERLTVIDIVE